MLSLTEGGNQTLVGPIPFCGEHPDTRVEDKFRSANQMNGISTALLHWSLKSSNRPGNRFPLGNYHHISFIRAIKSGVLTILIQKICHLQKVVSQPFLANREPHTVIANLNIQKWHVYHHGMSGKETLTKKLYFHKDKD